MARKSAFTARATPKPQGAMVINIHIDGDISLKLDKLVINNDNFPSGCPAEAPTDRHDVHATKVHTQAENKKASGKVPDDANESPSSAHPNDINEASTGDSAQKAGHDASNPCETPPSPESFDDTCRAGRQFKCRLSECDLTFANNDERQNHEFWTHFLCGRCDVEYASLDFADTVRLPNTFPEANRH